MTSTDEVGLLVARTQQARIPLGNHAFYIRQIVNELSIDNYPGR